MILQKRVDKHGKYISAHQQGLKARNRRTVQGLVVLVAVLVVIITAFTVAFCWKHDHMEEIENEIQLLQENLNQTIEELQNLNQTVRDQDQKIEELEKDKVTRETVNNIVKLEKANLKAEIMSTIKEECKINLSGRKMEGDGKGNMGVSGNDNGDDDEEEDELVGDGEEFRGS